MNWQLVNKNDFSYMVMLQAGYIFKAFPDLTNCVTLLWKGGFRIKELYNSSRWTVKNDHAYYVQTEKNGNKRTWQKSDTPSELIYAIENQTPAFQNCRYPTITRLIEKIPNSYKWKLGNKGICTHIFRYSKITEMHIAGSSDQDICDFIGEKEIKNIQGYYNAEIFYKQ